MPSTSTKATTTKKTATKKPAAAKKSTGSKELTSIEEKLNSLYNLQKIDSEIDRIRIIRGELPIEVEDLEDDIAGLETRTGKIQAEIDEIDLDITNRKQGSKDSETAIQKYKERQNNVRNNREYESLSKEIEFQELEIKLNEKRTKEGKMDSFRKDLSSWTGPGLLDSPLDRS